jgi:hypothetical protein
VAAALEPGLFSVVKVTDGVPSLEYVLRKPVTFQEAPELFCLDLYKRFDFDRLIALSAPAEVTVRNLASAALPGTRP